MEVRISVEKEFERQLRKLTKKYRSIIDDYETFLNELEMDPYQGSSLGRGVRKVRMAISPTTLSRICSMSEKHICSLKAIEKCSPSHL